MADQLHQRASAQNGHGFDRNALTARNDGGVADGPANHRIASADLFGHIHTTAARNEFHIQALLRVIALGLRQHPRPKRGQDGRGRQQISDLLGIG